MKHIQLFENFLLEAAKGGSEDFQFFPFDNQREPASKYNLPENLTSEDLISLAESNSAQGASSSIPDSAWQPGKGTGLFIRHAKLPNGFLRAVVRSVNPLTFDFAVFDESFEKVDEKNSVSKDKLGAVMKDPGGMRFLSQIRDAMPKIYEYLGGGSKASQLAADAGELYF